MHHCVFMNQGISPYYDDTDVYVTRQENDCYFYHNAATVVVHNECPITTAPENIFRTRKGQQKVCKSIGEPILALVGRG